MKKLLELSEKNVQYHLLQKKKQAINATGKQTSAERILRTLQADLHMEEGAPLGPARFAHESEVGLLGGPVAFPGVTRDAGADDVLPGGRAAAVEHHRRGVVTDPGAPGE